MEDRHKKRVALGAIAAEGIDNTVTRHYSWEPQ